MVSVSGDLMIPTERILEDAEIAALFLRALLDKGIPIVAALHLTSSYVTARQLVDAQKDKPREPWSEPDA